MTVEAITDHRLRVWLTDDEMEQWGFDQETPPMGRVRRLVRQIVTAAGWSDRCRVTAELLPVEGGGLLLVSGEARVPAPWPVVYRLQDEDTLLGFMRQWGYIAEESSLCAVYACEGDYGVAVYAPHPLSLRQQCVLDEYGTPAGSGEGAVARWGEYGRLLGTFTARAPSAPTPEDPPH